MACRYTYKGKVYSEEEFKALLASGELAKQHKEGKVKVQLPSSQMERMMARAEKLASAEGFKAGVEATKEEMAQLAEKKKQEQVVEKERKERVSAVRKNTRKISKASRSKVTLATDKSLLKGLGKVNANRLEKNNPKMFDEFEALSGLVTEGLGKPRINSKGELVDKTRWASNTEIQDFLDRYDEWLENDRKEEFFDAHLDFDISMDMTLDEMKQVVDSGKLKEGVNAEEVKANFEASVAKAKQQAKERIAELDKAFEGEELTPAEKEALKQIKKLNPDLLTPSQLMEVNQILENMVVNSSFDNSGTVVNLSIVTNDVQNAKKVLEKNAIVTGKQIGRAHV